MTILQQHLVQLLTQDIAGHDQDASAGASENAEKQAIVGEWIHNRTVSPPVGLEGHLEL